MAEWLKATDCKSVLVRVRRFETYSAHSSKYANRRICQYAKLEQQFFFLFAPLHISKFANSLAEVAHLVERQPSKLQVASSSLVFRSLHSWQNAVGNLQFAICYMLLPTANCNLPTDQPPQLRGRAFPWQGRGREFDSHWWLQLIINY